MDERLILLVEDDPDDEALTLRALSRCKLANRIVVARDGVEALDFMFGAGVYAGRDTAIQPELVLLDLKLPRLDGFEVMKRMRADDRTRLMPVVILTSSIEERDLVTGYSLGANSYIRKPVDFEQFIASVNQIGLYWLLLNERPPSAPRGTR